MKRAVHLDFHTSEYIPEVGADFRGRQFADRLKQAHVDSITLFARCHHGWLYYDSKREPEAIHPNLVVRNLLAEQIDACHNAGIRAPIYTTVQWDARIARLHPEWMARSPQGELVDSQNIPWPHFYHHICLNTPYREYLMHHVRDLVESLGADRIDGLFFDILFPVDCSCEGCRSKMSALSIDSTDASTRKAFARRTIDEFRAEMVELVTRLVPGASIFFNSSTIHPADRNACLTDTHLEIESLPSGGWGYDHFAISSRYARTLGLPAVGMTGRFHTYWGDFHSVKNYDALCFEVFRMLAMGAACCIGDQLHPRGALSEATYDRIGSVYQIVERLEPVIGDARPYADVAILWNNDSPTSYEAITGAMKMLQELSYQFDIIDSDADFSRYSLLILPDETQSDRKVAEALRHYRGAILGSFAALAEGEESGLFSEIFGLIDRGVSEYSRDFLLPTPEIGRELPQEEHVMYLGGRSVEIGSVETGSVETGAAAQVLARRIAPYFERAGERFTSHQHAPSSGKVCGPAVVQSPKAIYFAHPIFRIYRKNAAKWCKTVVADAIARIYPRKLVSHNGPSSLITSLHRDEHRILLHVLHYIPEKRSADIHTIEDRLPIPSLRLTLDRSLFQGSVDYRVIAHAAFGPDHSPRCRFDGDLEIEIDLDGYAILEIVPKR